MLRALLLFVVASSALALPPAPEELGRELFQQGRHADGTSVTAVAGAANLPLPSGFVACARCHGADARGRSEGGVTASDIRAETLTTPYAVSLDDGRKRPTYTAASFAVAVTRGLDPAGQPLNPAMPRYQLSGDEVAALFAYLGRIESATARGVDETTIRIGFVPPDDPAIAAATLRIMKARFEELNANGGIFRRHVALISATPDRTTDVLAVLDDNLDASGRTLPSSIAALHAVSPLNETDRAAVFAVFSSTPIDPFRELSNDALESYARFLRSSRPSERERLHQLTMLAAADLLVEALSQAGRSLTTAHLVAALEATGDYRTGFGFISGFAPTRHVAVREAPPDPTPTARR